MNVLLTIVFGLIILGILVFVHELGHFIAAKANGIRVLTFSLGFGNALVKKQYGETEYRISSIPFGGYVRMAGEDPEKQENQPGDYNTKPIWQRAIVAFAGPFSNVLFAAIFLWIAYMNGVERPQYLEDTTVGAIMENSSAREAGFLPGDSIIAVNDQTVESWEDIQELLMRREESYTFTIIRNSQRQQISFQIQYDNGEVIGGLVPPIPPVIGQVDSGSAAAQAGLKQGDTVLFLNGDSVYSAVQLTMRINQWEQGSDPIDLRIKRDDLLLNISTAPNLNEQRKPVLGVTIASPPTQRITYGPVKSLQMSLNRTWEFTTLVFRVIGMLFTGRASTQELAGPVGIIQISGQVAQQSFSAILIFMALLGVNLALINLLPLVITDGGVLLFLLIEAIRGRPLSVQTQSLINKIAIAFFLALFLFLTFNDVLRIF
ncbi:MAG: RIP metalloprotease RseP [Chitinispirillaceae bacterium]